MDENRLFNQLCETLVSINSPKEMRNFLLGILTPQERVALPKRLEIVKLLMTVTPQAKIAKKLGVGIATVTRGSRELKKGHFKYISWQPAHEAGKTTYR